MDKPGSYLAPGEKIPFEDGFVHYGKVSEARGAIAERPSGCRKPLSTTASTKCIPF